MNLSEKKLPDVPKNNICEIRYDNRPAIVVGSHPCWQEDVLGAVEQLDQQPVIFGCNTSGALVEADHMVTWHVEKHEGYKKMYHDRWGHSTIWHTGIRKSPSTNTRNSKRVDYLWKIGPIGGTSGWLAARVAKRMGCYPVILCGSPIDGDGGRVVSLPSEKDYWLTMNHGVPAWRRHIMEHCSAQDREGIFSMSGWTREVLGYPFKELNYGR